MNKKVNNNSLKLIKIEKEVKVKLIDQVIEYLKMKSYRITKEDDTYFVKIPNVFNLMIQETKEGVTLTQLFKLKKRIFDIESYKTINLLNHHSLISKYVFWENEKVLAISFYITDGYDEKKLEIIFKTYFSDTLENWKMFKEDFKNLLSQQNNRR